MKRKLLAKRFLTIVSLILVLSLPVATVAAAAEKTTYRQNGYAAVAGWYNEGTYSTIYTDDTSEGTDVYFDEYTSLEDRWSGYAFTTEDVLYVDHKLTGASLSANMLLVNWQTGEGRNVQINVAWTGSGEIAGEGKFRGKESYGNITVKYRSSYSSADATASGSLNGENLGELLFANITHFKNAQIIHNAPK